MDKQKLTNALSDEKLRLLRNNNIDSYDHALAINYLITGVLSNPKILDKLDDFPITDSAINDLETLYNRFLCRMVSI